MLRDLPPAALIDWQRDVQNTARRNVHDVHQRVERLLRQLFAEAFRDGFAQRLFAFGVDLAAFAAGERIVAEILHVQIQPRDDQIQAVLVRQQRLAMAFHQFLHQIARMGEIVARHAGACFLVALRETDAAGNPHDIHIRLRIRRPCRAALIHDAAQIQLLRRLAKAVAADAVAVPHGLHGTDIAEAARIFRARNWFDFIRLLHRHRTRGRRLRTVFMAADAAQQFAALHVDERPHRHDRLSRFVQSL